MFTSPFSRKTINMTISLDLKKNSGVVLDLAKAAPSLRSLRGKISWDMHPVNGKSLSDGFDLDLFVFCLDVNGKIGAATDVCFFNNKNYGGGSIVLPEDNRSGGSEEVNFTLDKIPTDRQQLDIYVFVFDYEKRRQNFGMMANAKFELIDTGANPNVVLQAYALNESYSQDTALHVGSLVRSGSGWNFMPVGMGAVAGPNDALGSYAG